MHVSFFLSVLGEKTATRIIRRYEMPRTRSTIKGIIIPAAWDTEGNVTAIAIASNGETEYKIEKTEMGIRLLSHLREQAVLRGTLAEEDGRKSIAVSDFSILGTASRGEINK